MSTLPVSPNKSIPFKIDSPVTLSGHRTVGCPGYEFSNVTNSVYNIDIWVEHSPVVGREGEKTCVRDVVPTSS